MRGASAIVVGIALSAPIASAQDACPEGRAAIDGHCCWPGQVFARESGRCEGPPECPAPLVEHGASCVAAVPSDDAAESVDDWPPGHAGHTLHRSARQNGVDGGLVAAALVVFDVGWVFGWLTSTLSDQGCIATGTFEPYMHSCNVWGLAWLPLGGGLASGLMTFNGPRRYSGWELGLGIPSVALEGIGLFMLAIALLTRTHEWGFPRFDAHGATVAVLPGAASTDVGATIGVAF